MTDVLASVTALIGEPAVAAHPMTGAVYQVRLASGTTVIAKHGPVTAEVAGLRWLADAIRVPEMLGADGEWLVLAQVDEGDPTYEAAEEFGRQLASVHTAGAAAFGQAPPGGPADAWIGMAPMANVPAPSWPEWYAEYRVTPYLGRCADAGTLHEAEVAVVERVIEHLPDLAGPPEPPARLHGDLWQGNVLWAADGHVRLIDPAAHGGHRETDLAMLALFGCPLLDRVLAAYQEVAPLADGWAGRVALHQLFPLLVHTELFGRGYAGRTVAAARRALADPGGAFGQDAPTV